MSRLLGLVLMVAANGAHGEWTLNNEASVVTFVSVKATHVAEIHRFADVRGRVDDEGNVDLSVELASVQTEIDIRDEAMREKLFETDVFPSADLTARVDVDRIDALGVGESLVQPVEASLSLHGYRSGLTVSLRITRLDADRLMVVSEQPVVLNARDFGLEPGLEALREIAGLPSISLAVPVTFVLVFEAIRAGLA